MSTLLDSRQTKLLTALPMAGSVSGDTLDTIFPKIDAEIAKHFEDRNILLTDGGTVTFTGTQVQFSENLNLVLNQKISGAVPQIISLGSASQNFASSGDMWVAVVNRTAGTATTSIITSGSSLSAVVAANQEVFLIAKRIDAGDGTQRLYFRNGSAFNAGQTARLGSSGSGSGSGSGVGDDLDSLQFQASFTDVFAENAANANSSINATSPNTNATFNAAKSIYALSYDAAKTVTTTGTAATMSAAPAFTVAAGDVLVSGGFVRKITVVTSQTAYTLESAFPTNLAAAAVTVSQQVATKDIYNLSVDGVALSTEFAGATFSEIMVDYKDNASAGSSLYTPNTTPNIAFAASNDNTAFTSVQSRPSSAATSVPSTLLSTAGTALYLRFFSNKTSGSGTVNLITYKAFMQKAVTAAGTSNVLWSTFAMTNNSTTAVNCTVSVVGGKTTIQVTNNTYPVGSLPGQTIGALEVHLNGVSVDRFVAGSTPTSDAYYTEVSSNVIQLDRDYSSQALSISLIYSLQVIDASTTNTTQLTYLLNFLSTPPVVRTLLSGSGTFNLDYAFYTPSVNATTGATYSHNGVTYTVTNTVSGSLIVFLNGTAAPLSSGTLTKVSGTGDSTILFYASRAPIWMRAKIVGAGAGGGGAGTGSPTSGGPGGVTSFGTSLLVANGGTGGAATGSSGTGGTASIGTNPTGVPMSGNPGTQPYSTSNSLNSYGGTGGSSVLGGAGIGGSPGGAGGAAATNSGSGGGGAGGATASYAPSGAGASVDAIILIPSPNSSFPYVVGAGGTAGAAGTTGSAGGAGGAGQIQLEQHYVGG
jgi:hypothetical protein